MSIPLPGRILPLGPHTFRALGHRNFRLLWSGQVVSLTGRWMQSVAQGWLVLRLSNSPFDLGLVGFCSFLPVFLFALPAGVAADRFGRRRALLWTQGSAMVAALVLTVLTWTDLVRVWQVALLAFASGLAGAFDVPVRQALLQDLVGRDDLPNAIALNSLAFNGARLVGPALGGLLLSAWGEAPVFLVNALTYLAVLWAVVLIRTDPRPAGDRGGSWVSEMRRGVAWALGSTRARTLLALIAIASVFGLPYSILLPVFARDILRVGASGLGWMMGAAGLGAVCGALYLAGGRVPRRRGTVVAAAMATLGGGLVAFSVSRVFWLSLVLLFLIGGAMLVQLASTNTRLQLLAPHALRGRVVSLYMLAFMGMAPLGSLLAGFLAGRLGTPVAVGLGGAVCLIAALWFFARLPGLRRAVREAGEREGAAEASYGRASRISTS